MQMKEGRHEIKKLGLDRYRTGIRYPILLAAAILIPIRGCTNFFVLKMRFCAEYICMWGICAKIRYRLETTGVRCNRVDC